MRVSSLSLILQNLVLHIQITVCMSLPLFVAEGIAHSCIHGVHSILGMEEFSSSSLLEAWYTATQKYPEI